MLSRQELGNPQLHSKNCQLPVQAIPIVSGAAAYADNNGITYILIINEALYYDWKLDHNLIDYWDKPYDKANSLSIGVLKVLAIPLSQYGTKLSFTSRTHTNNELENCMHIELINALP